MNKKIIRFLSRFLQRRCHHASLTIDLTRVFDDENNRCEIAVVHIRCKNCGHSWGTKSGGNPNE